MLVGGGCHCDGETWERDFAASEGYLLYGKGMGMNLCEQVHAFVHIKNDTDTILVKIQVLL